MRKYVVSAAVLLCIVMLFSGCINATYGFALHRDGTMDAAYTILFDEKGTEAGVINELLVAFRKHFTEDRYEVQDYRENGLVGILVTKKNASLAELTMKGQAEEEKLDYSGSLISGLTVKEGLFSTKYTLDTKVDLSFLKEDFLQEKKKELLPGTEKELTDAVAVADAATVYNNSNVTVINETEQTGQEVPKKESSSQEGAHKLLANANMRVTMQFPDHITATNAGVISENGKKAEWVLIPGMVNQLTAQGGYTNTQGIVISSVCLGILLLIGLYFAIKGICKK